MKKITVFGGGTGTFVVLSGLKKYDLDLAAIVSMMDSGGSTGRLRDQLEVLPPGDLRQCLLALSNAPDIWRKLFLYRFEKGDLKGHNFGNIFLSTLEKVSKNYNQVLEAATSILNLKGEVIPVTFEKTNLCAKYEDGTILKGEGIIDEDNKETSKIERSFLEPEANPNKKAIDRIKESDFFIFGPGDLYTSIIPTLLVKNIAKTIQKSHGKIIYIMNLMTKMGQTARYSALDHVNDLEKYLGKKIDIVILNNEPISKDILDWYLSHDEKEVDNNLNAKNFNGKIKIDKLIDNKKIEKRESDELTRSILRHDSNKLAKLIVKIIE